MQPGITRLCRTGLAVLILTTLLSSADIHSAFDGSVGGRVSDVQGAGVKDVEVRAQSASLLGPISVRTSNTGDYRFAALPAGVYVISFSKQGFVPVKMPLVLGATESVQVTITMHEGKGDDAVAMMQEKRVTPPQWSTSLWSTNGALGWLPISGTVKSGKALTTFLPGLRPEWTGFSLDGMPLRYGWRNSPADSFDGPSTPSLRGVEVLPARLSADNGRLLTGQIEAVTSAGGNRWTAGIETGVSGADRNADLLHDNRKTDGLGRMVEFSGGGPLSTDRLWIAGIGRMLSESVENRTFFTGSPYSTSTSDQFGSARVTWRPHATQRVEAQWITARLKSDNVTPAPGRFPGDADALVDRSVLDRAFSVASRWLPSSALNLSARFTEERGSTEMEGRGRIGTPLVDQQTGVMWGAASCGDCPARTVRHRSLQLTADTGFAFAGRHDVRLGVDLLSSAIDPESFPGDRFEIFATRSLLGGGTLFPVIANGSGAIVVYPALERRTTVRGQAFFIADRWQPASRLSIDAGLRMDGNKARIPSDGRVILDEAGLAPRVNATYLAGARRQWAVTAGWGRYFADPALELLDEAVLNGARVFRYTGGNINTAGASLSPDAAANAVLNWYNTAGVPAIQPFVYTVPNAAETGRPAQSDEWSIGTSRFLGEQGHVRIDLIRRSLSGFRRSDLLERRYTAMTVSGKYRLGHYADIEGQYTLSSLSGNLDDEGQGVRIDATSLAFPASFDAGWRLPTGSLTDDARHRLRVWAHSELMANDSLGLLMITLIHSRETGRPFGASGLVAVSPYVAGAGPEASLYFFTDRDAFRTKPVARTDLGLQYRRRLPGTIHGEIVASLHVLNLTGGTRLIQPERFVRAVTAYTDPSLQPFNPFTQTPVAGVHWRLDDVDANKDSARPWVPMTAPRTLRFILGIRY